MAGNSIDTIGFDWGGVLIENPEAGMNAYFSGILRVDEEAMKAALAGLRLPFQKGLVTEDHVWATVCGKLGVKPPERPVWEESGERTFIENADVLSLIQRLNKNGYKTGLISNTELPFTGYFKRQWYSALFRESVFSCLTGRVKPDSAIYRIFLSRMGSRPENTVILDDSQANIGAARRLGMKGILFRNYESAVRELESLNVKVR
jgi:putative hydrolase of the HAD superfamily